MAFLPLLAAAILSCSNGAVSAQGAPPRVALLIANGTYRDANLPTQTSAKDAALLADELGQDSFQTDLQKDLGKQETRTAIDAFLAKITPGATALFYYNGIGIQSAHTTYLIPVNAEIWSDDDVKREGISLDSIVADMSRKGAKVKIVIVDAARRNPFERRFRAYSAGLASIDAPEDTLVLYAVAPNKIGKDSDTQVSLFMNELVKELRTPDISAEEAMTFTRIGVSKASNGEEVPWVASSLVDPFYFGRGGPAVETPKTPKTIPPPPPPVHVAEITPPPAPAVVAPPAPPPMPPAPRRPQQAATMPPPPLPSPSTVTAKSPPPLPPSAPANPAATPGSARTLRDCADCPPLIIIPAGVFEMGSGKTPVDRPAHKVTIVKAFAIGESEVTFAEWGQCLTEGGCTYKPDNQGFGAGDHPVINVSWFDTKDYLAWLSRKTGKAYRLPTEAEWEYAAHGATTTAYAWGPTLVPDKANCADCGDPSAGRQTDPIKSFPPNGYGLYDMAGNAAEWVEDCWNLTYRGAPKDGSAWLAGNCAQRVLRGGSFDSNSAYVKPSARFRYDADVRYWGNGFRVVREVP